MASTGQINLSITPPTIIFICIGGAVLTLLFAYTIDTFCRRAATTSDGRPQPEKWNPNKRSQEQNEYMEKVRWRNKAAVWDRVQLGKLEDGSLTFEEIRLAVVRRRYEARRMQDRHRFPADVDDHLIASAFLDRTATIEEYLDTENPYRQMLHASCPSPSISVYDRQDEQRMSPISVNHNDNAVRKVDNADFEEIALTMPSSTQYNNTTGVRITVNDDSNDIVDDAFVGSSRWPPRQSRMFRSSSIYSGDAILPSTHLHLVQSSSTYDLHRDRPTASSREQQNVEEYELRNRGH